MSYATTTPNTVCPDLVDHEIYGYHKSHVVNGERHWVFESVEGGRKFTKAVAEGQFRRQKVASNLGSSLPK